MSALSYIVYLFNIIGLMLVGIFLLMIRIAPQLTDKKYHRAKIMLGCASLIVATGSLIQLQSYEYVDVFSNTILIVAALQACMFTFIVLTLLQSAYVTRKHIFLHLVPVFTFVILYWILTIFTADKKIFSLAGYSMNPLLMLRTLFAFVYFLQLLIYIQIFRCERRKYIAAIENYFADIRNYELYWVSGLFYQATGVGVAVLLFLFFPTVTTDLIITLIVTVFYFLFSVGFINYQYGMVKAMPAISQQEKEIPNDPKGVDKEFEKTILECQLFLKQGMVLADYAAALHLSERKLSGYINSQYGITFKHWVNIQRVEHVKKLIVSQPELSIELLAESSGFANKSHLSKVFKEVTGNTFSAEKKNNFFSK